MEYSYEILKAEPRHKYLSVRYYAEGQDDFFKNFNPEDWSSELNIKALIEQFAPLVIQHWSYQQASPNTSPVEPGTIYTAESELPNVVVYPDEADPPEYDWVTQWIELNETPDANNVLQWIINEYDNNEKIFNIRRKRDGLLRETDFYALSDTVEMDPAMATYRQALRDITDQSGFPDNVTWPTKP